MRDATTPETRTASEILFEARDMQARHGGPALLALFRALRRATLSLAGARGPLGAGQVVLH